MCPISRQGQVHHYTALLCTYLSMHNKQYHTTKYWKGITATHLCSLGKNTPVGERKSKYIYWNNTFCLQNKIHIKTATDSLIIEQFGPNIVLSFLNIILIALHWKGQLFLLACSICSILNLTLVFAGKEHTSYHHDEQQQNTHEYSARPVLLND